jgi:FKBP-type peptidyl-prolyl cis-trans isomerase SlpA
MVAIHGKKDLMVNENMMITNTAFVTLHYRLALTQPESLIADSQEIVNTFTGTPATLQMGTGQWPPTMEQVLYGLKEGERTNFELKAADTFGERNPELVQKVSLSLLKAHSPEGVEYVPGDLVEFPMPEDSPYVGGKYTGILKSIDADGALFDFNHPLAGKDLTLEVEIIGIL